VTTLESVIPTIRSSDESLFFTCPTLYYIVRRLGLTPRLRQSEALTLGSWFHTYMQMSCEQLKPNPQFNDETMRLQLELVYRARERELLDACLASGIVGESQRSVLETEQRIAAMAQVFQRFALDMTLPDRSTTLLALLKNFRVLEAEPRLLYCSKGLLLDELAPPKLVAQPDALLYHEDQRVIWIADWKTCAGSARTRLATCPHEFQTQHYLYITQQLLPLLIAKYELHPDTKLAGVMHVALQKCPLVFGTKDRWHYHTAESKRSKRAGNAKPKHGGWQLVIACTETGTQITDIWVKDEDDAVAMLSEGVGVKTSREYAGEPSHDRYVARCSTWYRATGEYQNLAVERQPGDIIDISYTHNYLNQPAMDRGYSLSYFARLHKLVDASYLPYTVGDFPRRADHLRQWGKLNPYFMFYESDFSAWGDVASRLSMTPNHRDKDLLDATESAIIPTPLLSDPHNRGEGAEAPEAEVEVG
jgi:hypothetical protein